MGTLVSSAEPREQVGVYWGYTVRYASSFSNVFSESPFKEGYDLKIGTSNSAATSVHDDGFRLPRHRHALVVFGGLAGIEECVNADETVPVSGEDAATLFDVWVKTCPTNGSRSIRSEEAVLMSLATLRKPLTDGYRKP
jgi:methyltransferase